MKKNLRNGDAPIFWRIHLEFQEAPLVLVPRVTTSQMGWPHLEKTRVFTRVIPRLTLFITQCYRVGLCERLRVPSWAVHCLVKSWTEYQQINRSLPFGCSKIHTQVTTLLGNSLNPSHSCGYQSLTHLNPTLDLSHMVSLLKGFVWMGSSVNRLPQKKWLVYHHLPINTAINICKSLWYQS